mgnify:FL=1
MLFNSYVFPVFFLITYLLYRILPHRGQNLMLLVASYVFYGWWNWIFLSLIAISTVIDYVCGIGIHKAVSDRWRRGFLAVSMCGNLGMLGFFKYYDFFAQSLSDALSSVGFNPELLRLEILLPVGISFYTFQTMSYTIDIYRREMKPTRNFFDFALFVSFFPQLVAGPIERASRLLPQVTAKRSVTWEKTKSGLALIAFGYFKKLFVADNMAVIVNQIFEMEPSNLNVWYVTLGAYAFAFQIYGDFSGYSNIARGISRLLGFELMVNFRAPYLVKNPAMFWRHWHISLSSWLRDYLYISLGGNRLGKWRTKLNLFLTMVLGGLWHGAAWNFVWWGIYQGGLLMAFRSRAKKGEEDAAQRHIHLTDVLKWIATFQLICLGWLIFRAESGAQLWAMLRGLGTWAQPTGEIGMRFLSLIFFCWFLVWEQYDKVRRGHEIAFADRSPRWKFAVYAYLLFCATFMAAETQQEFIYFQF